ncbi:MAG: DUF4382 domain-containing protein [Bacteroidetes bacterium]|nr:MAG: DUF4382 domain-containing protein [Bacteroidota bacterium]
MRQITSILVVVLTLAVSLVISACDSNDNSFSDQSPRIKILLTDAPRAQITKADVTISRVEIVGADGDTQTLSETEQDFDLLTLQDGTEAVLVDTPLNEGVFNHLLLFVEEDANVTYDDDSVAELTIPSGFQSGVKILLHDVELYNETDSKVLTLTLDFDVLESFVDAGESGKLIFMPVITLKKVEMNGEALLLE